MSQLPPPRDTEEQETQPLPQNIQYGWRDPRRNCNTRSAMRAPLLLSLCLYLLFGVRGGLEALDSKL